MLTLDEVDERRVEQVRPPDILRLPQGERRGRSLAVGDIDGDGKNDVVVTDPANAQFLVYRQSGRVGTERRPELSRPARRQDRPPGRPRRDGKGEVYVLSEQEKQIGRSRSRTAGSAFPTPLPISGEPVAMDLADLDGDKVARDRLHRPDQGRAAPRRFELRASAREKSGDIRRRSAGAQRDGAV